MKYRLVKDHFSQDAMLSAVSKRQPAAKHEQAPPPSPPTGTQLTIMALQLVHGDLVVLVAAGILLHLLLRLLSVSGCPAVMVTATACVP